MFLRLVLRVSIPVGATFLQSALYCSFRGTKQSDHFKERQWSEINKTGLAFGYVCCRAVTQERDFYSWVLLDVTL